MPPIVADKLDDIAEIARKHGAVGLYLFGSALSNDFDPQRSDLDLLVEFRSQVPVDHANSYFGLMEDLHELLGLRIDLIELAPITNPYFREEVEKTRFPLYEAA